MRISSLLVVYLYLLGLAVALMIPSATTDLLMVAMWPFYIIGHLASQLSNVSMMVLGTILVQASWFKV